MWRSFAKCESALSRSSSGQFLIERHVEVAQQMCDRFARLTAAVPPPRLLPATAPQARQGLTREGRRVVVVVDIGAGDLQREVHEALVNPPPRHKLQKTHKLNAGPIARDIKLTIIQSAVVVVSGGAGGRKT